MKFIFIPHLPTLYGRRYNLSKAIVEKGNEVHFIIWDLAYPITFKSFFAQFINSWRPKSFKDKNGIYIHKIVRIPFFAPVINGVLFRHQIRRLFKKHNIDFVISQSFTNETDPPLDLPLIYDLNDDHLAYAQIYGSFFYKIGYKILGVRKTIEKQIIHASLVTAVSDRLIEYASKYNTNVLKIPNGIDDIALNYNVHKLAVSNKHKIIYVSTFGKWSCIIDVIKLVPKLLKKYPDLSLSLVGAGTEIPAAKTLVNKLQLHNYITFYDHISDRQKVFELISESKVCLNISEKNKFRDSASPMKILDYSVLGKDIVSTNLDEVIKLNFPNVITYRSDVRSKNLEKAIINAINSTRDNRDIVRLIHEHYTWSVLISRFISNIERSVTL